MVIPLYLTTCVDYSYPSAVLMFGFPEPKTLSSKAYVSTGPLAKYVDPQQPPSKKKPYSIILNQPFNHTVCISSPPGFDASLNGKHRSNFSYQRHYMILSGLMSQKSLAVCNTLESLCPCLLCLKENFSIRTSKQVLRFKSCTMVVQSAHPTLPIQETF